MAAKGKKSHNKTTRKEQTKEFVSLTKKKKKNDVLTDSDDMEDQDFEEKQSLGSESDLSSDGDDAFAGDFLQGSDDDNDDEGTSLCYWNFDNV